MTLRFISPLHKATRQLSEHLGARMKPLGLTPGESHLLSYLFSYGPCPVSELVRVFGIKRSTLTSMLDRTEESGYVTRDVNPKDRRSFMVALTPAGRRMARKVNRPLEDLEATIAARLGDGDLAGFRRVMEIIAEVTGVEVRPTGASAKKRRKERT